MSGGDGLVHTVPRASLPIIAAHAPSWPHSYLCLCERILGKLYYKMAVRQVKSSPNTAQLQHATLHGCWVVTASLTHTLPLPSPLITAPHDPDDPTVHSEATSYITPLTRLMADPRPPRITAVKHNKSLTSIDTYSATLCLRRWDGAAGGRCFRKSVQSNTPAQSS